jgi:hypothetical protein
MKLTKQTLREIIKEELQLFEKKNKGLWANIHAKRKRGEKPAKPGDEDYPKTLDIDEDDIKINKKEMHKLHKGEKVSKNGDEIEYDVENMDDSKDFQNYMKENYWRVDESTLEEAEYQGRDVKLGKPMQGDVKKFKVYVKNPKGNVVKVNFGQKGMNIKKDNPGARKSFRARHKCDQDKPRTSAGYWSCRKW